MLERLSIECSGPQTPMESGSSTSGRAAVPRCAYFLAISLVFAVASSQAIGQTVTAGPQGRAPGIRADIDQLPTLRVKKDGSGSEWLEPGGDGSVAGSVECPGTNIVAHTDANFGGGEFIVQAGFVEGEIAAASFVLDPSAFPIQIHTTECIFAQQAASVETETKWSMIIYDGPPDSGIEVLEVTSDGKFIPHLILPPGTQGANLSVEIDPGDPDQVFIFNESGTNMFSVGYRVDEHNNQSGTGCVTPPPSSQNAFPTTDTSGVATMTGNWLFAIDCGPFGCPAGWSTFQELPGSPGQLCTPSGDWVIRATFTCQDEVTVGACCINDGNCFNNVDSGSCALLDGLFQGEATTCEEITCPQPEIGACCDPVGTCQDDVESGDCAASGGTFQGDATLCLDVDCPEPPGACCFQGQCLSPSTEQQCSDIQGTFLGSGATCADTPCQTGACCMGDGSCSDLIGVECDASGGTFQGSATSCATFECPDPIGACCISTVCFDGQTEELCTQVGVWQGIDTVCDAESCIVDDCPQAMVLDVFPAPGIIDARQPSPPGGTPSQGIGSALEPVTVFLEGPGSTDTACWELCETDDGGLGANAVAVVTDVGGNAYELTLLRPITTNAVTSIAYSGSTGGPAPTYTSHPANANADSVAGVTDVLFLIDVINGSATSPFGEYSEDIDRSGLLGASDVLRTIDLLNGTDAYPEQNLSPLPSGDCP